jgi:CubicO group peptidase (beta-lactamase class C family)
MKWFGIGVRLAATVAMVLTAGCTTSHRGAAPAPATSGSSNSSAAAARFPDPVTSPFTPAKAAALQAVLDGLVADYVQLQRGGFPATNVAVPGVTAAVQSDQGAWIGAAGRGGDGSLLSPHAVMAIGSISKTFTAAEVLHLAAAGKIDLDAPLSKYVQHRLTSNGATVRQALNMTSGLPFDDQRADTLTRAMAHDPGRHWSPRQLVDSLAAGTPSRPGGDPAYSSANYLLLGMLIEHVTQQPLAAALHADLFSPAGLDRVAVQDSERPSPPLATPPTHLGLGPSDGYLPCRAISSAAFSAGGMAADAPTLARWGYQLYGARLLSADTVHAMVTQQSTSDISAGIGYGMGTMMFHNLQFAVADSVGHRGGISGYVSLLAVVPERHLSVVLLIDDDDKDVESIMNKLFAALR